MQLAALDDAEYNSQVENENENANFEAKPVEKRRGKE
jgi:hypothetical protein